MSLEQCRTCGAVVDDGEEDLDPPPDNYIACHTSGIGAQCKKCYAKIAGKPPPFWPEPLSDAELNRLAIQQGWA